MDHWIYESMVIQVDCDNPGLVGEMLTGKACEGWTLVTVCPVPAHAMPPDEMHVFATFRKACEDAELHNNH